MPCSDGYGPRMGGVDYNFDYERSEKRRHKLAAELCKARALIVAMQKAHTFTDPALLSRIAHEVAAQHKHRVHDKEVALSRATDEVVLARREIKSVRALGGIPGPKQRKRLREAITARDAIKASDPMNTDLY